MLKATAQAALHSVKDCLALMKLQQVSITLCMFGYHGCRVSRQAHLVLAVKRILAQ